MQAFFPDLKSGATFEVVAAAVETGDITAVRSAVRGSTIQKGWRVQPSVRAGAFTALTVLGLFILDIVIASNESYGAEPPTPGDISGSGPSPTSTASRSGAGRLGVPRRRRSLRGEQLVDR